MTYFNRAGKVLVYKSSEMIYDIYRVSSSSRAGKVLVYKSRGMIYDICISAQLSRQHQLSSHRTLLIPFRHIEMDEDYRYPSKK